MKSRQRGISITDEDGVLIGGQIWNLLDPDDVRAFACRVAELHPTAEWLRPIVTEAIEAGLSSMMDAEDSDWNDDDRLKAGD